MDVIFYKSKTYFFEWKNGCEIETENLLIFIFLCIKELIGEIANGEKKYKKKSFF